MTSSLLSGFLTLTKAEATAVETRIPAFVYGTAWKKERTTPLVLQALTSGFSGIDTAAQPKHYREPLVGNALRQFLREGKLKREDIYVQTKFTTVNGQDINDMPYHPMLPIPEQIKTSVKSSLTNLQSTTSETDSESPHSYLDCLVMHSPFPTHEETVAAWQTLEEFVPHQIRHLGISNVDLPTLRALYNAVRIKPAVVQNRFYPQTGFDVALRKFCREQGMIYQSFWTLTANPGLMAASPVTALAKKLGLEKQVALYCLVLGLENVVVLNGTTDAGRMIGDLQGIKKAKEWIERAENHEEWISIRTRFETLIGDE